MAQKKETMPRHAKEQVAKPERSEEKPDCPLPILVMPPR
jgi:hypothetical protein